MKYVLAVLLGGLLALPFQDQPERIDELIQQLGSEDPSKREAAERALVESGAKSLETIRGKFAKSSDPHVRERLRVIELSIVQSIIDQAILKHLQNVEATWKENHYLVRTGKCELGDTGGAVVLNVKQGTSGDTRILDFSFRPVGDERKERALVRCVSDSRLRIRAAELSSCKLVWSEGKLLRNGEPLEIGTDSAITGAPELLVTLLPFDPMVQSLKIFGMPLPLLFDSLSDNTLRFATKPTRIDITFSGFEKLEGAEFARFELSSAAILINQEVKVGITVWVTRERRIAKVQYRQEGQTPKVILSAELVDADVARIQGHALAIRTNECEALRVLKVVAKGQMQFRRAFGGYWVADVSGLYRVRSEGSSVEFIPELLAKADARPVPRGNVGNGTIGVGASLSDKPVPTSGYLLHALPKVETQKATVERLDPGGGVNKERFSVCAIPESYDRSGKLSFVLTQEGTIYSKDLQGKAPEIFPFEPEKSGWAKLKTALDK